VEKPFATGMQSAERMISAARSSASVVSCNQNMRYFSDFLKIKEIISTGVLGRILQIRIAWHRFRRRWDWQTLREYGGGNLNNDGAHVVDLGLQLFGEMDPSVFARVDRSKLSSGDAENHVKIVLSGPGSPVVDLEMTDNCAYPQPAWLIMGSQGTLTGTAARLEWKYVDPLSLPAREVSRESTVDRSYNSEQFQWIYGSCEFEENQYEISLHRLYKDLYQSIRLNRSPSITLESIGRQISILEECRRQGGLS
jgi:predicted dehydrogenase